MHYFRATRNRAWLSLLILPFLLIGCQFFSRGEPLAIRSVNVVFKDKSLTLHSDQSIVPWSFAEKKDFMGEKILQLKGLYAKDLITFIEKRFETGPITALRFESTDGYAVDVTRDRLLSSNSFLALEINGSDSGRFYNETLKAYFNWRPSYLIPLSNKGGASPYQVSTIKVYKTFNKGKWLKEIPKRLRYGAYQFSKTCQKCHSYKGEGGRKAPPIDLMTVRWPKDSELAKFLRSPQTTANRKFEMSPFKGSDEDLNELIKFLRHIQFKN